MIRWLLLLFGGALLGGIVHLATIIILPRTATQDAYSRLAPDRPGQHRDGAAGADARNPRRCRSWIRLSPARSAATICRRAR